MPADPPTASATYFDQDNLFLEHLNRGFAYLNNESSTDTDNDVPRSRVSVHFLDPTSAASGRIQSPRAADASRHLELYQKITNILLRDYKNTLKDIPYKNIRTGESITIPEFSLQPTVSHGGILMVDRAEDASEWHQNPMTYVYLAECHSLEHYRLKVKPSIQIFVSQLQANPEFKNNETPPNFLIVVVPNYQSISDDASTISNTSSVGESTSSGAKSRVAAFASRVAAARHRISGTAGSAEELGGGGNNSSDDELDVIVATDSPIRQKTKLERDLLRKMHADFPSARVCALAALAREETPPLLEWESFLSALGATIVDNLHDKCRNYEEVLKKVSADHRQYFLVKESMAFSYEQCQLYADALVQYEELRAMLPDWDKQSAKRGLTTNYMSLPIALRGDPFAFRQHICAAASIAEVAYELEYYLLMRETTHLFAVKDANAVLQRCLGFARKMWQVQEGRAGNDTKQLIEVNKWGLEFGWVVKEATYSYTEKPNFEDKAFSATLCELMGFTRLRLLKMGKLMEIPVTPNLGGQDFPSDLKADAEWAPWSEPTNSSREDPEEASLRNNANVVADALSTKEGFEWMYMSLTKLLAANQEASGKKRLASCLRIEAIDIAIKQNRLRTAAQELFKVAQECEDWKSCYFFLLFRLCQLQRQFEPGTKYLETLVCCFGAPHAPPKARDVVFRDLLAVISGCDTTTTLSGAPLFQTIVSLDEFELSAANGTERKLFKRVYTIGDTVTVKIIVTSQLPEDVKVGSLSISLVPFRSYVAAMEDNIEVKETEVFSELQLSDVTVKPGRNEYQYKWVPNQSGQFILSAISMSWNNVKFVYSPKKRKQPTIRVDVIPCEHSQMLTIAPNYLIPGHTQNLLLKFSSGKDTIIQGKAQLVGSPGIFVGKQDDDTLLSALEIDLNSTSADSIVSIPIKVQCADNGGGGVLKVQTNTQFCRDQGEEFEAQLELSVPALGQTGFVIKDITVIPYRSDRLVLHAAFECHAPKSFLVREWKIELPAYLKLTADLNETLASTDVYCGETIMLNFECRVTGDVPNTVKATVVLVFDNEEGVAFEESHTLRQACPKMPLPLAEMPPVSVNLMPSVTQGIVGRPVQIKCIVDVAGLNGQDVRYKVASDASDWIISGRTEGLLPENAELELVGIPTRPGSLSSYVHLSLRRNGYELPISISQPGPFQASDPPRHSAAAYPFNGTSEVGI
jgi:hypothetical protein